MLNSWIAFCYTSTSNYNLFQKPIFFGKLGVKIEFFNSISSVRVMYFQKTILVACTID